MDFNNILTNISNPVPLFIIATGLGIFRMFYSGIYYLRKKLWNTSKFWDGVSLQIILLFGNILLFFTIKVALIFDYDNLIIYDRVLIYISIVYILYIVTKIKTMISFVQKHDDLKEKEGQ
jgi:uncharacterized membrane protein HdeD (DUF308 family)